MRLDEPLLRLPITFDAGELAAEVAALPERAWVAHPNRHPGNAAVRLVTTNGAATDDTATPMAPTGQLAALPGVRRAMAAIGATWGRSRLMRLAPGAVVPVHIDTNFYWRTHIRLHVPITTTPEVLFTVSEQTVHMAAGECWAFDTFANHHVRNGGPVSRVHLVLDTVGGEGLHELIAAARAGAVAPSSPAPDSGAPLVFEWTDGGAVMSPWELQYHLAFIAERAEPGERLGPVLQRLDRFAAAWAGAWAQFGQSPAAAYRTLIAGLEADLPRLEGQRLRLRNQLPLYRQVAELVFVLNTALTRVDGG